MALEGIIEAIPEAQWVMLGGEQFAAEHVPEAGLAEGGEVRGDVALDGEIPRTDADAAADAEGPEAVAGVGEVGADDAEPEDLGGADGEAGVEGDAVEDGLAGEAAGGEALAEGPEAVLAELEVLAGGADEEAVGEGESEAKADVGGLSFEAIGVLDCIEPPCAAGDAGGEVDGGGAVGLAAGLGPDLGEGSHVVDAGGGHVGGVVVEGVDVGANGAAGPREGGGARGLLLAVVPAEFRGQLARLGQRGAREQRQGRQGGEEGVAWGRRRHGGGALRSVFGLPRGGQLPWGGCGRKTQEQGKIPGTTTLDIRFAGKNAGNGRPCSRPKGFSKPILFPSPSEPQHRGARGRAMPAARQRKTSHSGMLQVKFCFPVDARGKHLVRPECVARGHALSATRGPQPPSFPSTRTWVGRSLDAVKQHNPTMQTTRAFPKRQPFIFPIEPHSPIHFACFGARTAAGPGPCMAPSGEKRVFLNTHQATSTRV